jgi:hypothetical protein
LVNAAHLRDIAASWSGACNEIVASGYGEHAGPPVLLPEASFAELQILAGDQGARQLFSDPRYTLKVLKSEPAGIDIDTPEDLAPPTSPPDSPLPLAPSCTPSRSNPSPERLNFAAASRLCLRPPRSSAPPSLLHRCCCCPRWTRRSVPELPVPPTQLGVAGASQAAAGVAPIPLRLLCPPPPSTVRPPWCIPAAATGTCRRGGKLRFHSPPCRRPSATGAAATPARPSPSLLRAGERRRQRPASVFFKRGLRVGRPRG